MNSMKLIFVLSMMGLIVGCHTNDYLAYEEPKAGIYIAWLGGDVFESTLEFYSWESSETKQDKIRLDIMGFTADVDREISLELVDSLTTAIEGQDYVLEKVIMPAKTEFVDAAVIRWNRRPDGDDGRPDTLTVGLRLVENEYFKPVTLGSRIMKLTYLKTDMQAPYWWIEEALGPWSKGLMFKFLEQYNQLEETNPEIYQSIHKYVGDNFSDTYYWPWSVDYLVIKYVVAPLYNYYQEHPEPGVVDIPKPKY